MNRSPKTKSFLGLISQDKKLKTIRKEYAQLSANDRRKAAEWEYDSEAASEAFNAALQFTRDELPSQREWPAGYLSLAIDPLFAPALLTVGSVDYHHGHVKDAMEFFLLLTTLPKETEDLPVIIDKAGDFLLDQEDYQNALVLYLAAEKADPETSLYLLGSGYCYAKLGKHEDAVHKGRRAVELDPDDYKCLNDLGFSLIETGQFDEAETVLNKAIRLAPPDYKLAQGNLRYLQERRNL